MSASALLGRSTPKRVLPGFSLSLGITLTFVSLILLLPLTSLVGQLAGLSLAEYLSLIHI